MENELTHWGIPGMRWGVRRYQNKDGTLTPAGKKRYEKEMEKLKYEEQVLKNKKKARAKLDKINAKKKAIQDLRDELDGKKTAEPPKTKTIKDLSDEEINRRIERLNLEKRYREAMGQPVKSVSQEQTKKGIDFVEDVWKPGFTKGAAGVVSKGTMMLGEKMLKKLIKTASEETKKK